MPRYEYQCAKDGSFEVFRPLGQAERCEPCPACGEPGARLFAAPMLSRTPRAVGQAIDRAERSRESPEVVPRVPPQSNRSPVPAAARNPALRRLPRP